MHTISLLLQDNFELLNRHIVGKSIKKILDVRENNISFLLDDGTIIMFSQFEDELIFDIELLKGE
ncbi:MAG: hypothetical protein ABFC94_04850 [Syntrophomonas sp.]